MSIGAESINKWDWLDERYGDYQLAYLDPMVCDLLVTEPWRKRIVASGRRTEAAPEHTFLKQLTESLSAQSKDDLDRSLKRASLGSTPEAARALQRGVTSAIVNHFPNERRYSPTSLQQTREPAADSSPAESLILVEGVLALRATVSKEDKQRSHATDWKRRRIECLITEKPLPIMTLNEPTVRLVVDSPAFNHLAASVLGKSDWYPFAQAFGLYATDPLGLPFVNVAGILTRPHPTMNQVLRSPAGEDAGDSLPGVLRRVKSDLLDGEVDRLQETRSRPGPFYEKGSDLLYPACVFALHCQLNSVDRQDLRDSAPEADAVFSDYVNQLRELALQLDRLNMASLLKVDELDPDRLLARRFAPL